MAASYSSDAVNVVENLAIVSDDIIYFFCKGLRENDIKVIGLQHSSLTADILQPCVEISVSLSTMHRKVFLGQTGYALRLVGNVLEDVRKFDEL